MARNRHTRPLFELIASGQAQSLREDEGHAAQAQPVIVQPSVSDMADDLATQAEQTPTLTIPRNTAILAVAIAVLMIFTGFIIGRQIGLKQGARVAQTASQQGPSIADARQTAPDGSVLKRVMTSTTPAGPATAQQADASAEGGSPLVPGKTYLVIQEFRKSDIDKAREAKDFLAQKGIDTVINMGERSGFIYSAIAFDLPAEETAMAQYKDLVERWGRQYGVFNFKNPYPKLYKG